MSLCDVCGVEVVFPRNGTLAECRHVIRLKSGETRRSWQPAEPSPEVAPMQPKCEHCGCTEAMHTSGNKWCTTYGNINIPLRYWKPVPAVAPRETQTEPFVRAIFEAFYADAKDQDAFEIFQAGWNAALIERGR